MPIRRFYIFFLLAFALVAQAQTTNVPAGVQTVSYYQGPPTPASPTNVINQTTLLGIPEIEGISNSPMPILYTLTVTNRPGSPSTYLTYSGALFPGSNQWCQSLVQFIMDINGSPYGAWVEQAPNGSNLQVHCQFWLRGTDPTQGP